MISDVGDGAEAVGWPIPKVVTEVTVTVTCDRGHLQSRLHKFRPKGETQPELRQSVAQ